MLSKIKNLFGKNGPNQSSSRVLKGDLEVSVTENVNSLQTRYPLTITVHNANGGYVLSSRRYNKKIDEYDTVLYIVHEEEEVSKTVEKIIFIDNISR
jgi:hypothetical protein